jgi:predicted nucleic acid-binding protein
MKLFIDTNIFLSFYHLSSDDLEELKKLAVLLDQKKVELFLPQQVVDEFRRNREVKIADALKRFREEKLNDQFPQICKEYEEYPQMREAIAAYKEQKSKLLEKLSAEIASETLKADKTILELFGKATGIEVNSEIVSKARWRMVVGNPPGKNNSAGDAINWECLLQKAPDGHALFFITDDGDYSSPVDESEFLPFLQKEWAERKKGKIRYFNRLSAFFRSQFPDIRLARELEKELLIRNLAASPNFATTRKLLKQLVEYADFTATQLNDIVQAAITNNQIFWIAGDEDINEFLHKLIAGNESKIQPTALKELKEFLGDVTPAPAAKPSDDEVPF